jgi:hypothetical protein
VVPCHALRLNCESPILRLLALLSKGLNRVAAKLLSAQFFEPRELPSRVELATHAFCKKKFLGFIRARGKNVRILSFADQNHSTARNLPLFYSVRSA